MANTEATGISKSALGWTVGLLSAAAAAALTYMFVHMPGSNKQPPGDPPVTVSDGSLHAHSKPALTIPPNPPWLADQPTATGSGQIIQPYPPNGTLSSGCTDMVVNSNKASAYLWTDDENAYDITPSALETLKITITHDSSGTTSDSKVIIKVPPNGQLTITTNDGSFDRPDLSNRLHSRRGNVESIKVEGSAIPFNPPNPTGNNPPATWVPYNLKQPHFTLGFCYK
jgi:hypothetical protein